MNEFQGDHSRTINWILSLPGVPRPIIAALFGACWAFLYLGVLIEYLAQPEQVWWLTIWKGAFGGNGFSAFGGTILALTLTSEVIFMIFSLGAYLRQKERFKKEEERFKKEGERLRDEGERLRNEEERIRDEGERIRDEGERIRDEEERFRNEEERFRNILSQMTEELERAAQERARAGEEAASRASQERDQAWNEWLELVKPDLDAGRPPSVPPPSQRNGAGKHDDESH